MITGDVADGRRRPTQALEGVRLLMLANDVEPAQPDPGRAGQGLRLLAEQAGHRLQPGGRDARRTRRGLARRARAPEAESVWNGKRVGLCDAGPEMTFHFGQLIAHICKTRNVRAGSIVGSGTVSNKDWSRGYSCIAEKRAIETIEDGAPKTAVHAVRRHDPHRDEGRATAERVRRDRAEGGAGAQLGRRRGTARAQVVTAWLRAPRLPDRWHVLAAAHSR